MQFPDLEVWDDTSRRTPATQMAVDEALVDRAASPVLRLYRWAAPALTFGYAQRWAEVSALADGRPLVRRWTGGGVVFHGNDLTLTLAVPPADALCRMRTDGIYRAIHEAILGALGGASAGFRLALPEDCRPGTACFVSPALHDILLGGQKICGGALRRGRRGVLYQGSLHRDLSADLLGAAFSSRCRPYSPAPGFEEAVDNLARTRYAAPDWNELR